MNCGAIAVLRCKRSFVALLLARSGLLTMYTVCAHATTDVLSPLYGWLRFPVVRVRPVLVLQMHSTQEEGPGRRTAWSLGEHGTARGQSFMTLEGDLDEVRCGVVSVRGATASGQVVSHCKCDARSLDFTVRVLYLHTLSSERLRTRSCPILLAATLPPPAHGRRGSDALVHSIMSLPVCCAMHLPHTRTGPPSSAAARDREGTGEPS